MVGGRVYILQSPAKNLTPEVFLTLLCLRVIPQVSTVLKGKIWLQTFVPKWNNDVNMNVLIWQWVFCGSDHGDKGYPCECFCFNGVSNIWQLFWYCNGEPKVLLREFLSTNFAQSCFCNIEYFPIYLCWYSTPNHFVLKLFIMLTKFEYGAIATVGIGVCGSVLWLLTLLFAQGLLL